MQRTSLLLATSWLFVSPLECELHKGRIFVDLICSVSQAQYLGQNEPSINELRPGAVDRNFSTLCVYPPTPDFYCGFMFLITDFWLIMLCTWFLANICFPIARRMRLKHFFVYLLGSGFTFIVYPGEEVTIECWVTEVRSLFPVSAESLTDLRPWADRLFDLSEFVSSSVKWE